MGQCVSIVPAKEAPKCRACGKEASGPWAQLCMEERARWVWIGQRASCRSCLVTQHMEKTKFEKERKAYAKAKEEMYPKPTDGFKPLKKVKSGERWDNTRSFSSAWRPSSSLRRLLSAIRQAQEENPGQYVGLQRKPTGFVPAAAPGGLRDASLPTAVGNVVEVQPACSPIAEGDAELEEVEGRQRLQQSEEEFYAECQAQLAALEGEYGIELVEEESLAAEASLDGGSPTASWSPHCGLAEGEESSEPPQQQQPEPSRQPPDCWQPLSEEASAKHAAVSLKGRADAFHGDSAFLSQQAVACQWVASRG